ncbi:GNAT family N-acetyltransferase [Streptomyces sp. NPDC094448]|uniref:GNAT family N-acetyltransferase n=1 Tax=Streptomyces sp. NPDC094448 TaxID=3366063 RepID=UPI0037FAB2C7
MFAIPLEPRDGETAELRPLEPWQAEEFLAHVDRGRDYIGRYIGFADAAKDLAGARTLLQRYADRQAADGGRIFGIWLDGTLVGGVLFVSLDTGTGACEAGCWLEPAAVGRGLVTQAARILFDWAVDVRGMHRVEWVAASVNTASVNVARRLGMQRDGVLRESFVHRGERYDMEVWSVLAPEWRELRAGKATTEG